MGFYVELFCDNPDCASGARQEGPQGNNRGQVARDARAGGWVKTGRKWECPDCARTSARSVDGEG